MRSYCFHL